MRIFKKIAILTVILLLWTAIIGYGFFNGFLLKSITAEDSSKAFLAAAKEKLDEEYVGNVAMVLIENGIVKEQYFYAAGNQKIDQNSAFPVASISKWVTAFGVLKLVEGTTRFR